jgi:hypothetical protein
VGAIRGIPVLFENGSSLQEEKGLGKLIRVEFNSGCVKPD